MNSEATPLCDVCSEPARRISQQVCLCLEHAKCFNCGKAATDCFTDAGVCGDPECTREHALRSA